eukprot:scaffold3471_cov175-Amphora_coffeaeformis.AAC.6
MGQTTNQDGSRSRNANHAEKVSMRRMGGAVEGSRHEVWHLFFTRETDSWHQVPDGEARSMEKILTLTPLQDLWTPQQLVATFQLMEISIGARPLAGSLL